MPFRGWRSRKAVAASRPASLQPPTIVSSASRKGRREAVGRIQSVGACFAASVDEHSIVICARHRSHAQLDQTPASPRRRFSHSESFDQRRRPIDIADRDGDGLFLAHQHDKAVLTFTALSQILSAAERERTVLTWRFCVHSVWAIS
jgi:hypothetical protein